MARKYRAKLTESGMYTYKVPRKKFVENLSEQQLKNEVMKLVQRTNKKLDKLIIDVNKGKYNPRTKRFERKESVTFIDKSGKRRKRRITNVIDYRHTFASKKLEELENYKYRQNKILLTGNESKEELLKIRKLTSNFLESKTSTISGIKDVEKGIKKNISQKLDEFELTPDEADSLFKLFGDKDFIALKKYLDPSELQALLLEVRDYKNELSEEYEDEDIDLMGMNKFQSLFTEYVGLDESSVGRDIDLQNSLKALYDKIDDLL